MGSVQPSHCFCLQSPPTPGCAPAALSRDRITVIVVGSGIVDGIGQALVNRPKLSGHREGLCLGLGIQRPHRTVGQHLQLMGGQ